MKSIFDKIELNNLKLKNRLVRSPTWEYAANADGGVSEALYGIHEELAAGGVGGIITGFTSASGQGRALGGMMR